MNEKRYSVFISSTYEDLKDERLAVQDVVLSAGDFPVQMESFPAADKNPFDYIKTLIDACDYFVLIIAGRYGTCAPDGVGYTEMEYNYATAKKIPVFVMLHGNPGSIPANKTENSDDRKNLLDAFKAKVSLGRLCKKWDSTDDLKFKVLDTLVKAKKSNPSVGWVRGNSTASAEVLQELNEVRKENEKFRDKIGNLVNQLDLPPIPNADTELEIDLIPIGKDYGLSRFISGTPARIKCTWISVFPLFCSALKWYANDWNGDFFYNTDEEKSCHAIGEALAAELTTSETKGLYAISHKTFEILKSYYIETGLMLADGEQPFSEFGKQVARRQRIANIERNIFSVVSGNVRSEITDGIPF